MKESKATIAEETEAVFRTQGQAKTELSEAVAEVPQVRKHCESQIEELEDVLRLGRG